VLGGFTQRRAGAARHDAVAWGYARAASALGVDIIEDCEVTGVRAAGGAATGVETTRGHVQAERIVFATAGHTGTIGTMLGTALPIETHLLQAMVSEPIKPLLNSVVVYVSPGHGETYICQSDRGGLVMGGHLDGFPSYTREGAWHREGHRTTGHHARSPAHRDVLQVAWHLELRAGPPPKVTFHAPGNLRDTASTRSFGTTRHRALSLPVPGTTRVHRVVKEFRPRR